MKDLLHRQEDKMQISHYAAVKEARLYKKIAEQYGLNYSSPIPSTPPLSAKKKISKRNDISNKQEMRKKSNP